MKKDIIGICIRNACVECISTKKALFLDNEPWENVLKQAQKANKKVFVDCYTSWCVPCKHLMNVIFPQK